uniref:Uncharacterized protein n=1 Tax=Octopus bimaculoides TaxID=37653 RepID=A0A0L8HED4_OCTBM
MSLLSLNTFKFQANMLLCNLEMKKERKKEESNGLNYNYFSPSSPSFFFLHLF